MELIEVIFCYNCAKYEASFVILFLLLLEMIWSLNLLKYFPPHFNCIVTLLCQVISHIWYYTNITNFLEIR